MLSTSIHFHRQPLEMNSEPSPASTGWRWAVGNDHDLCKKAKEIQRAKEHWSDEAFIQSEKAKRLTIYLEEAKAISARWQVVVRALHELKVARSIVLKAKNVNDPEDEAGMKILDQWDEVWIAMTGTLEDIERALGIEVK